MNVDFPEITSFGTLLKFAIVMENRAAELMRHDAEGENVAALRNERADCAGKHVKRAKQLERLRRERLNEVVLQAIHGMDGSEYAPALELPRETPARPAIADLIAAEETVARFYEDAARTAANVLTGVEKTFRRLARESASMAASLRSAEG
jgi:hypothetical protein